MHANQTQFQVRVEQAEPILLFTHLKEEVNLLPRGADQTIKLVQSLSPVL